MTGTRIKAVAGLVPDVATMIAPDLLASLVPDAIFEVVWQLTDALGPQATALLAAGLSAAQWAHQVDEAAKLAGQLRG